MAKPSRQMAAILQRLGRIEYALALQMGAPDLESAIGAAEVAAGVVEPEPQTDWSKMTVADLTVSLENAGVEIPPGALKADLVALAESEL